MPSEQSKDCTDVSARTFVRSILLNVGAISGMQAMGHYDRDVLLELASSGRSASHNPQTARAQQRRHHKGLMRHMAASCFASMRAGATGVGFRAGPTQTPQVLDATHE